MSSSLAIAPGLRIGSAGHRAFAERIAPSLRQALWEDERDGLRLALRLRLVALSVIAVWVVARVGGPATAYYLTGVLAFAVLGYAEFAAMRLRGTIGGVARFVLVFMDMGLLAFVLVVPSPWASADWPLAMQLRLGNFDYFYVFMAFAVLSLSPGMALTSGLAAALCWSAGVAWVLGGAQSFSVNPIALPSKLEVREILQILLDPNYVSAVIWVQETIVVVVVAGILAAAVQRSRQFAVRQARTAAERANLARYFSPNMVDQLATAPEAIDAVRSQNVAVLFVDIVGFTRYAQDAAPEEVIAMLREFHGHVAAAVFAHGGTLDKYIGDAVMATFGTPRTSSSDASDALRCASAILDAIDAWNAQRHDRGEHAVEIGVGVHYGRVVMGDIGDERCLAFAVIGDTVNVASRLEGLTRTLGVRAVLSDAVVAQARREAAGDDSLFDRLAPTAPQPIAGRHGTLSAWVIARAG